MMRCLSFVIALGVAGVLALPASAQFGQNQKLVNDLKQIGLAYHNFNDATNKAPAKAEDLAPYLENNKRLIDMLKNGEVVFAWGVTLREIAGTTGASTTVLAYEKAVPTKGGYVLIADGSVKKMTADDFKKANVAKKK
jgi:hypothetical protein